MAYWLLTGQRVFVADSAMATLMAHVHEPPAAPSTRTSRPIPPAVDQLVLACLAKDPSDRPPSARALATRLSELPGVGEWTDERARACWDEHRPAEAP